MEKDYFKCQTRHLDEDICQKLLNSIAKQSFSINQTELYFKLDLQKLFTEDLDNDINETLYLKDEINKFYEYKEKYKNLNQDKLDIIIDSVHFYCSSWEVHYRILCDKSSQEIPNIKLIKTFTIEDTY